MGTNYYGMKIPTEEDKIKIKQAVDNGHWGLVKELIPEKIHIGKSSGGWQFCFDHNYWQYFDKDYNEIKEFINSLYITDEYGENITRRSFWKKVERKKEDGRVEDEDIMVGGLRFAPYTDFS